MTPKEKLYFELTRATEIHQFSDDSIPAIEVFEILEKHLPSIELAGFRHGMKWQYSETESTLGEWFGLPDDS